MPEDIKNKNKDMCAVLEEPTRDKELLSEPTQINEKINIRSEQIMPKKVTGYQVGGYVFAQWCVEDIVFLAKERAEEFIESENCIYADPEILEVEIKIIE